MTPVDAQTLQSCEVLEPCHSSTAQLVENSFRHIDSATPCVLAALGARTPGRYEHQTDNTFSNGAVGAKHYLIVNADGSVLYARAPYLFPTSDQGPLPPDPGERCTLKPASYFDDCAQAVADASGSIGDTAWHCAFGAGESTTPSVLPWFEACSPESPLACEE
jgi:hypothetical protein